MASGLQNFLYQTDPWATYGDTHRDEQERQRLSRATNVALNKRNTPVDIANIGLTSIPSGPLSGDSISYEDLTVPPGDFASPNELKEVTQALNPYTQLDPFSIDPYVSDTLEIDPETTELSSDEDYKNRLLDPKNSFDSLITTEARSFMNDSEATDQEKKFPGVMLLQP